MFNINFWNLYKPAQGQQVINLFNDDVEAPIDRMELIFERYLKNSIECSADDFVYDMELIEANIFGRGFYTGNEASDREAFRTMIESYDLLRIVEAEDGNLYWTDDTLLPNSAYRRKAFLIPQVALCLYYANPFFKPIMHRERFGIVLRNCKSLGIEMPEMPHTKDYRAYLMYYYDVCCAWQRFQDEHNLTPAECCACIYDFAPLYETEATQEPLPAPTNVWITGASKRDFAYLDSLGREGESVWACDLRTKPGDIVIIYARTPRSYIHSIWRAQSGGMFCPFDYYQGRTTVSDGVLTPEITLADLKADPVLSQHWLVRKTMQGVNGVEFSAEDYLALLQLIERKGGNASDFPKLYEADDFVDFGELIHESDVEEKILIPALERLGYTPDDWSRQLSLKAGRKEKAIPDFVFFPHGAKHAECAPMVIEAKFKMASPKDRDAAFRQCQSYAKMLSSGIMAVCDRERLVVYKSTNGQFDPARPLFEEHWQKIYCDVATGARLKQLIGQGIVSQMK